MSAEELQVAVAEPPPPPARVVVTDVDVSFGSMVWLLVKLAFAAIPAAIIVGLVVMVVAAVIKGT